MKAAGLIIAVGLLLVNSVWADALPPPPAEFAISHDGSKIVRLSHLKPTEDKREVLFTIHAFDSQKGVYLPARSFTADLEAVGEFMFVSNDGRYIVIASNYRTGVRIFDRGTLRRSWPLKELLTGIEIEACPHTGATTQWFDHGSFVPGTSESFFFSGPSTYFYKGPVLFKFRIDLTTCILRRE